MTIGTIASVEPGPLVLLADDDAVLRGILASSLERVGYRTIAASDGSAALAAVRTHDVDLVLLDVGMPGMTGLEVVTRIRADPLTATVPVILVTGSASHEDVVRGLEAGADDFVGKHVHFEELLARVRARMRNQRAWVTVIADEHALRDDVISALARLRPGNEPEAMAAATLEGLVRLTHPDLAMVLAVTRRGLRPLAEYRPDGGVVRGGRAIPAAWARHLLERAGVGPWTEELPDVAPDIATSPVSGGRLASTVGAPIYAGGSMVGLLSMAVSRPEGEPDAPTTHARLLAAAIDFAAVLSAAMGPALANRGAAAATRAALIGVLSDHAFHTVYQPIVRIGSGQVLGYEALTRFRDGARPDVRFQEAEAAGLGFEYETAALESALQGGAGLAATIPLFLNVSPAMVLARDRLARLLRRHARPVVIEVTEHVPIDDYAALRRALASLGTGVLVAVDDAGAGYASLRHILELRPAYAKLDVSIVRDIDCDTVRQAMVAGLEYFAVSTGCQLIAEGVETKAEAVILGALGVTLAQGYLFARPGALGSAA